MSHRHKHESPGWQSEAFDNQTHNDIDFATARGHRKGLPAAPDDLDAPGECRMLSMLQDGFAKHRAGLYPLDGDKLLLSLPGDFTRTLPDMRAARVLLRRWGGRA